MPQNIALSDEVWKTIPDIPSMYQVSNLGNVRKECIGGGYKLLRRSISDGYYTVCFEGRQFKVHILVAKAFLPNPEGRPEVSLKDRNKLNPELSNLEWVWPHENMQHAIRAGSCNVKLVRCVETGQTFIGLTSASYYFCIPVSCIRSALKTNQPCFGKHFEYAEDNDNSLRSTALYLSERKMIELSQTLHDPSELVSHFLEG